MSAIAGILHLNGERVEDAAMREIVDALAHLGPDGHHLCCRGPVAFAQLMMWTTQESLREVLPLWDSNACVLLTADARIDNRDDLAASLSLQSPPNRLSDSDFILAAYLRWGEACVTRLVGSFAFALWDERRRVLFCATDPLNSRPLHYSVDAHQVLFASEVAGILAAGVSARLDERRLALSALSIVDLTERERTYWQEIHKLPAATLLQVSSQGVKLHRYWQPDPTLRLPYKTDAEWVEAFRAEMTSAIDGCTRSAFPVAAMLSGGLDSSALVGVAAQRLAEQGRTLITVSGLSSPQDNTGKIQYQDERSYIEEFRKWDNLTMVPVMAEGRGPFDKLEQIVRLRMTPEVDARHFLMTALTEAATAHQARTLLTGMGGEFGPTTYGDGYLAELLVRGQWWRMARESWLRSRREARSLGSVIKGQLLYPLIPDHWRSQLRPKQNAWHHVQPLRKEYVESILGPACWQVEPKSSWRPLLPNHRYEQAGMLAPIDTLDTLESYLGYDDVRLRHPYLNKRLIEFCLAAPGHMKVRNGYRRYLLRAGLEGLMPPSIQWRTTKEPFSTDYPARYNRQRAAVQEFLASIAPNDPVRDVVDVPRLQTYAAIEADSNRAFTFGGYVSLGVLPRSIALIHFLQMF